MELETTLPIFLVPFCSKISWTWRLKNWNLEDCHKRVKRVVASLRDILTFIPKTYITTVQMAIDSENIQTEQISVATYNERSKWN